MGGFARNELTPANDENVVCRHQSVSTAYTLDRSRSEPRLEHEVATVVSVVQNGK
jgi:hypothetical protein